MSAFTRAQQRRHNRRGTRVRASGLVQCHQHSKVWYPTEADARRSLVELVQRGTHDPGLEAYWCDASNGWHLGHAGGWKSLGRRIREAQGLENDR